MPKQINPIRKTKISETYWREMRSKGSRSTIYSLALFRIKWVTFPPPPCSRTPFKSLTVCCPWAQLRKAALSGSLRPRLDRSCQTPRSRDRAWLLLSYCCAPSPRRAVPVIFGHLAMPLYNGGNAIFPSLQYAWAILLDAHCDWSWQQQLMLCF